MPFRMSRSATDQNLVNLTLRIDLVSSIDGRDFAGQALQRRLIELALRIALFALIVGAVQVADDFGNRDQVS